MMAVRHTGIKSSVAMADLSAFVVDVRETLKTIHSELLESARGKLKAQTFPLQSYEEMKTMIAQAADGNREKAGFYLVPWKCNAANEDAIKEDCKATIRCYPLDLNSQPMPADAKCFYSKEAATHWAIFARAF